MPTFTVSREQTMTARPAREVMKLEKQCEIDPHPNLGWGPILA